MKTEIEYVAYHRVKRLFIPIMDIESENPEDIEVYEFEGQNFKLIAKWEWAGIVTCDYLLWILARSLRWY